MFAFIKVLATVYGLFGALQLLAQQPQQTIAPTPPMGWNTWNYFGDRVNEEIIRKTADAMVSSGLRDAGYQYIVIDDVWEYGRVKRIYKEVQERSGRDANGRIIVNAETFPSGMKALGDYIHSKGLKFGIYTAPGIGTCYGCTGSLGYEVTDLKTFAEWGVDYIKLDGCFAKEPNELIFKRWRHIIDSIGRPIVLSTNIGSDFALASNYVDMWRTTNDIMAVWKFDPKDVRIADDIFGIVNLQVGNEKFQSPGHWNDPDMLQVGNGNLSYNENKCHFGMWAILGAPLILGNNLYEMKDSIRDLLANPEVIAIDQDPAGIMGSKVYDNGKGIQVWVKQLWKIGDEAIAFLNASETDAEISVNLAELGITGQAFFRDALARKDLGVFSEKFSVRLKKNDMLLAKVTAFEKLKPIPQFLYQPIDEHGKVTRLEAEDALFYASKFANTINKFSGAGYMMGENHGWANQKAVWNFSVANSEIYQVTIRFINLTGRPQRFRINDNEPDEQRFVLEPVKKPDEWQSYTVKIQAKPGNNHIKLESPDNKSNAIAIDWIEITTGK